jgi:uncharacterized repeat protein (TIGR03803 family)
VNKFGCWMYVVCLLIAGATITSPGQTFKTLASFDGPNGSYSIAPLVQGADGNFYGTTDEGGTSGLGTVFKITQSGKLTSLHSFCTQVSCSDGKLPAAALIRGMDGNFYGTTESGGNGLYGGGTIFKITPTGWLTTLYSFCLQTNCPDGDSPNSLVQGFDGNFYGTTYGGGASNWGSVFKMTPQGKLVTLYSFCAESACTDGSSPESGLMQSDDGDFYGTTYGGSNQCSGSANCGTVFKISPSGQLVTLYAFCALPNCADGSQPSGLALGSNGSFYGTTYSGGTCGYGTFFSIGTAGLTTIYSFCAQTFESANPVGTPVQGSDGRFYGTTSGGSGGTGTVFKITPGGDLTTLYTFCSQMGCADGSDPLSGLVQGTNGSFYGTTVQGGNLNCDQPYGCGTIFALSVGLRPFIETEPTFEKVAAKVIILGTSLTGATSVTFNGTAAQFTVISSSEIKTTVPVGATTGKVEVVTPQGTLLSNVNFRVLP